MPSDPPISGRCYCGKTQFVAITSPQAVAYCHCVDCRRVTGAPVAAFAAFKEDAITFEPALGTPVSVSPGVRRWFCDGCGSPVAATYDYLPGQVYVGLGLIDQAADLPPGMHSHASSALPWLHIVDDVERNPGSGRDSLTAKVNS